VENETIIIKVIEASHRNELEKIDNLPPKKDDSKNNAKKETENNSAKKDKLLPI
jgi:hypothetical protein